MVSCTLQKPLMAESVWQEAVLEKVTLEEPQGQGMRAEGVKLDYCVFEREISPRAALSAGRLATACSTARR